MKSTYLLSILSLFSCNNVKKESIPKQSEPQLKVIHANEEIFFGKVVIILSEELNDTSSSLNIQNYIENGKSFIPIFSSIEKFNQSSNGTIKNPKIEIDGIFLLSILKGNETLKLNPGLEDETTFKAELLIEKYSKKIGKLNREMKNLKGK